jgi:DNA/RNA-binding domain of Phe-tRNA-synthetase-like protein
MFSISIEPEIRNKCPQLSLDRLTCTVNVSDENEALLHYVEKVLMEIRHTFRLDEISKIPAIQKAREAYKMLGKDPARYRLSAEALLRRILQGKSLYKVNNVIDILNIVSVQSGISIGGYDTDKIRGEIVLSAGNENTTYNAIGRGLLNIGNLPVLRDSAGFFGNPSSDSERTSVTKETRNFLMVFFNFEGSAAVREWLDESKNLLVQFAQANEFIITSGHQDSGDLFNHAASAYS